MTSGGRGIAGFQLSPTGDKLVVWADKLPGAPVANPRWSRRTPMPAPAAPMTSFSCATGTHGPMATRSQLFVLPVVNGKADGNGVSLMGGLVGDTPSSAAGRGRGDRLGHLTARPSISRCAKPDGSRSLSTNLDIFSVARRRFGQADQPDRGQRGMDNLPTVSPDGKWLAWAAMARAGYEADRHGRSTCARSRRARRRC